MRQTLKHQLNYRVMRGETLLSRHATFHEAHQALGALTSLFPSEAMQYRVVFSATPEQRQS